MWDTYHSNMIFSLVTCEFWSSPDSLVTCEFWSSPDRQKAMHMSPPCNYTGGLKNEVTDLCGASHGVHEV